MYMYKCTHTCIYMYIHTHVYTCIYIYYYRSFLIGNFEQLMHDEFGGMEYWKVSHITGIVISDF